MSENRKIAQNSLILYLRLLLTTIIGLLTTRLILKELGADDYGLYMLVGGVVTLMNFMNSTMTSTSNRFLAVEIGKNEGSKTNVIFNSLFVIHIFFGLFLYILTETIGVWYVNNHLNADPLKIPDALFVLRVSVVTAVITTLSVPYQGLVTVYEKFSVRATIEVLNSILNFIAVLLLLFSEDNKLRIYTFYVFILKSIISIIYYLYCKSNYREIVKWKLIKDKAVYKEISDFFTWQTVSVIGSLGASQGGAIVINLFFGTTINAAFGLATRVNQLVYSFVKTLNQAALPQIMKNYSGGNQSRSLFLVYKLSKYTFYIMLIPAIPVIISINTILNLWLTEVPPFTAWFVVFRIGHGLVSCLESGFDAMIEATGKIKRTKIIFSILFLMILPVSYLLYKQDFPPYTIAVLYIISEGLFLLFQTRIMEKLTEFRIKEYINQTVIPVITVSAMILPQFFLSRIFDQGIVELLIVSAISAILTSATIYFVGLNSQEKELIASIINKGKVKTKQILNK